MTSDQPYGFAVFRNLDTGRLVRIERPEEICSLSRQLLDAGYALNIRQLGNGQHCLSVDKMDGGVIVETFAFEVVSLEEQIGLPYIVDRLVRAGARSALKD